jgi:hypothetical protein
MVHDGWSLCELRSGKQIANDGWSYIIRKAFRHLHHESSHSKANMKTIRTSLLIAVTAGLMAACGTAGQASMAAPTLSPTSELTSTSPLLLATPELPVPATVIITLTPAEPVVTVTAPPPVISTVTQTEQPPVIVVPDPTTVYAPDYDGPYYLLPDGLYCRDLKDMGFSFADAINYWNYHGQPSRMDLDLNGIPCETVY